MHIGGRGSGADEEELRLAMVMEMERESRERLPEKGEERNYTVQLGIIFC